MAMTHSGEPGFLASVKRGLRGAARACADLAFPPQCLACRAPAQDPGALCAPCWSGVGFITGAVCIRCGLPFEAPGFEGAACGACLARPPAFDRARAVFDYETGRDLILPFKHADRVDLAPAFARWAAQAGRTLLDAADVIVPVPLHRWRLLQRRYNQAALIAQALGRLSRKPVDATGLVRTRQTPSQGLMVSPRARRRNVLNAFAVLPRAEARLRGRRVLLIDDVFTTGATVEACARVLRRAGAASVDVLTLARVVRPGDATLY
jgi:ComF family protein